MIFSTPTYIGQPAFYQGRAWFWNGTGWQVQTNLGQTTAALVPVGPVVFDAVLPPAPVANRYQLNYV